ncbi:MAG: phenylalanine--tRNA ligase subunit beta [bacterium]
MPVVSIATDLLCQLMGRRLEAEELGRILTELGCDVEGIDAQTAALKINLLPVRPDMFDVCGLARCLKGYLGIETGLPEYRFPDSGIRVEVKPGLEKVRQFIAAAVARGLRLDDQLVGVIMDLQENLHWGLGRDRRRASIGIYDLNTVEPDFTYGPVLPDGVRFVPLGGVEPQTPAEILQTHPKGQAYRHLLQNCSVYPLLADRRGEVLSMPPIINSEPTRVSEKTTDLFIDVTGPEPAAVAKTLAVIAAVFADLGARVERVTVIYPDNRREHTPDMTPAMMVLTGEETCQVIGISLTPEQIAGFLQRMRYGARVLPEGKIQVLVPAYRSDVMHTRDLIEDVAIGYGYHNLTPALIPTLTPSRPLPLEERCTLLRRAMTGLGFIEIMSLVLSSPEAQFERLNLKDDGQTVVLENPISIEQRILRRHLLTGIMDTFRLNSTQPLPQKLFEIGDVFRLNPAAETGAQTQRRLGFGIADAQAGFADVRSVIEALAREMDWPLKLTADDRMPFITGRSAAIIDEQGATAGWCGEVHPEVLERFGLTVPVVLAEIEIGRLLGDQDALPPLR